ncbi:hypothetical protein Tco_0188975 [Tanacetum coccineum]
MPSSINFQQQYSKRAGDELEQENAKKQKVDDDKETIELQSLMDVIPDEVEVVVAWLFPLATKAQANGRIVKIKRLLDDLRATATQVRVTAAKHNLLLSLMLLVQKLLLLVFRVNAASTKLQLLKDYDSWKSFYCQGMDKDCLEKR